MAGNDWINSYLEAILDVDAGINDQKSSLLLRERGRFSPAQYFVEEVITGFDETDLHRSWVRVRLHGIYFHLLIWFRGHNHITWIKLYISILIRKTRVLLISMHANIQVYWISNLLSLSGIDFPSSTYYATNPEP